MNKIIQENTAVFKTTLTPEEKLKAGRSTNYGFFDSNRIVQEYEKLGWVLVGVNEQKSKVHEDISRHLLRFRKKHSKNIYDLIPEIMVTNSHNGQSALKFHFAVFNPSNEDILIIQDPNIENLKVRHMAYNTLDTVIKIIKLTVKLAPNIETNLKALKDKTLTPDEQITLANKAIIARNKEILLKPFSSIVDTDKLNNQFHSVELLSSFYLNDGEEDTGEVNLTPRSALDTLLRVHENLIKGYYYHYGINPKKARELFEIRKLILVNKELWAAANELINQ